MGEPKRSTVYLEPAIHRALKIKAAETGSTISDLINQAVRRALAEDAVDLKAFEERAAEPSRAFEDVLGDLKKDGLI
jgi:hypothetical protein